MKLISLTLLALCIIGASAQSYTCQTSLCAKATEVCGPTANNTRTYCRADSYCSAGDSGPNIGVCIAPFKLGDTCESSNCESGTTCITSGDNSICALNQLPQNYLHAGEGCKDDKQCSVTSPYSSDDYSDRCKSGKCRYIKNGDYCSRDDQSQCNYNNAYCGRTRQCTKYISKGGACYLNDATENGCGKAVDSACIPNGLEGDAGSCQKLHSRKAGEICSGIDHCKEGLWCRKRDFAARGICAEIVDSATINKPCLTNLDCTSDNNEICECGKDGNRKCFADVRQDGYHSANKNFEECDRKKGCNGSVGCIIDNCKSQYCKYQKVQQKSPFANVNCRYEGICNSAFSLVASPVLALLAFIVVMAL